MGHGALSSEGRPDGQLQRMGETLMRKQPAQGQPRSGEAEGGKNLTGRRVLRTEASMGQYNDWNMVRRRVWRAQRTY